MRALCKLRRRSAHACLRRRESRRPRAAKLLSVGQPLTQQALKLGEDTLRCVSRHPQLCNLASALSTPRRRCSLTGLLPSTGYEVRVSYAGTVPAAVHLAFSTAGSSAPRYVPGAPKRGAHVLSCPAWASASAGYWQCALSLTALRLVAVRCSTWRS